MKKLIQIIQQLMWGKAQTGPHISQVKSSTHCHTHIQSPEFNQLMLDIHNTLAQKE